MRTGSVKYQTKDGCEFTAVSPTQVVQALRESSKFADHQTVREFMTGFTERTKVWSGHTLRTDTTAHFVEDLLKHDIIRVIQ